MERRNAEVMKHLRAIVFDMRLKEKWSFVLPMVQRILNCTYDSSIGTYPAKILFGNKIPIQLPIVVKLSDVQSQPVSEYLVKLQSDLDIIVDASQQHIKKLKEKGNKNDDGNFHEYKVGDYVMLTYPTRPPHKLSPIYRGPLKIVEKIRGDIFKCQDLISNNLVYYHISRLVPFYMRSGVTVEELINISSVDKDEYFVEAIVDHRGNPRRKATLEFRVRWRGYVEADDTWLLHREVKDLEALDTYLAKHPELKL